MNDIDKPSSLSGPMSRELLNWFKERGLPIESIEIQQIISRPIPPPEDMESYARIDKDFPGRLMDAYEREQEHRHSIEKKSLEAAIASEKRGQHSILWISILLIICSTILAIAEHPGWGIGIVIPGLGGLAYTLIAGRRRRPSE